MIFQLRLFLLHAKFDRLEQRPDDDSEVAVRAPGILSHQQTAE